MATEPVVIIGGGPAGCVAAALLAKNGVEVVVLEADRHPRHHVGESLQPASFQLLDHHFGLAARFAAGGYARKYGALYVWGESREPWSVLFDPRLEADLPGLDAAGLAAGGYESAWQVDRASFDQILAENARSCGAEIREGVEVSAPILDGDRVVGVRTSAGEVRARRVLDASGQRALLGRAFGLVQPVPDLLSTATYAYFDGCGGVPGVLGREVQLIVSVPEGWIWFIPISPTRTSVGVVVRERARLSPERYFATLAQAGLPMSGAIHVTDPAPFFFVRDWSFQNRRTSGPGWSMIGDAACFVDPILSGGVDFAIRGALNAALGVLQVEGGAEEGAVFGAIAEQLGREYRAYLRLARYWYGNNRSVQGFFWEAKEELGPSHLSTPLRAFVWLTSGRYAADTHLRVFQRWQEEKMFRQLGVDGDKVREALARRA